MKTQKLRDALLAVTLLSFNLVWADDIKPVTSGLNLSFEWERSCQDYKEYNSVVPGKYHTGIDISGPGKPVYPIGLGKVVRIIKNDDDLDADGDRTCGSPKEREKRDIARSNNPKLKRLEICEDQGWGNTVIIEHKNGKLYSQYSHLSKISKWILEGCLSKSRRSCQSQSNGLRYQGCGGMRDLRQED